jgi:hypothetical protein
LGKEVTVVDSDGNTVTGTVSSVNISGDEPTIEINGTSYTLDQVTKITGESSTSGDSTDSAAAANTGNSTADAVLNALSSTTKSGS